MTRKSIQKISILGLILVAASAVTAAVMPSNEKSEQKELDGQLVPSTRGSIFGLSCIPDGDECEVTQGTDTTSSGNTSGVQGPNFTSAGENVNTTT